MNDLFMNDTLDNIVFTQTENFLTNLITLNTEKSTVNNPSLQIDISNPHGKTFANVTKNEISFDDSVFLSESLSFSGNSSERDKKELKNFQTVLQDNKNEVKLVNGKNTNHLLEERKVESPECTQYYEFIESKKNKSKGLANILQENKSRVNNVNDNINIEKGRRQGLAEHTNIQNSKNKENLSLHNVSKNINKNPLNYTDNNQQRNQSEINQDKNVADKKVERYVDPELCKLSSWGLPESILEKYKLRNIINMFPWQVECLSNIELLNNYKNLVYSAPTSAGKTLVAEILAIKTIFERHKKVLFILPFVSIVREKMYYFQDILASSGIRVEGFMGSYNPPGGFSTVDFAICTIEKANSLVNRLLEDGKLSDIGAVLVDEVHLLGDPSRGYLLELLLTKLRYISKKDENVNIQVIGMSATLPNLNHLAKWLEAELYTTDFRPIPLLEQAHVCGEIYDNNLKLVRKLSPLPDVGTDTDNILQLCLETIKDSCSVLIFCPTKNWCENLSQQIAVAFFKIGSSKSKWGELLRSQLKTDLIMELLEQLKYCPVGLDSVLRKTVSFGVAFHHAGLTMDERDIIEGAFRNGALRVLVATSTLSSGVNLPARRVIIRTPQFHGRPIDTLTYRQMIGRAGRMGKDSLGESFLICQKSDYKIAKELMSAELSPVESCLEGAGKLKRAILEVVASGVASSPDDVSLFTKCTLLAVEDESLEDLSNPIEEAVNFLKNNEFIRLQKREDGSERYIATSLGKACLSSSMAPDEGLALFTELEKARQCFVLETELHLIYLVTPYNACNSWDNIDWMLYLELWERLPSTMKRVGELVGVQESYIINATRGKIQTNSSKSYHKLLIHKRFFVSLALQDLVNEKPLAEVCAKFNCNRGMLQSLQQSASSFAGMVTSFSHQLGWSSVELLLSQFQDRMQFGVSRDLLDLMRLPILNGSIARILYNAGIQNVAQLANSDAVTIENILCKTVPFETKKEREGESEYDKKQRNKFRIIWVTGREALTEGEAAEMLVTDARKYLKYEMGLAEAKWETDIDANCSKGTNDSRGNLGSMSHDSILQESEELEEGNKIELNLNKLDHKKELKQNSDIKLTQEKESDTSLSSDETKISPTNSFLSEESFSKIEDDEDENNSKNVTEGTNSLEKHFEICTDTHNSQNNNESISNSSSFSEINFTSIESNLQNDPVVNNKLSRELESFSTSNSFSDINFTNIEENIAKVIEVNKSDNSGNKKSFKRPCSSFIKTEVSQLLLTPPQTELNISDSSVFSSHSNINISINNIHSDQSLFDDSFNLQLSESDKESSRDCDIKKLNHNFNNLTDSNEVYNIEKYSENDLNNSDDILLSSFTDEMPITSKKRKSKVGKNLASPCKKQKRNRCKDRKKQKDVNPHDLHSVTFIQKKSDTITDLSKFNFLNVCENSSQLELFEKELILQKNICLSLACSKVVEEKPTIGMHIIQPGGSKAKSEEKKFCYKSRRLEGIAVTWDGHNIFYCPLIDTNLSITIVRIFKSTLTNKNLRVTIFDSKEQIKLLFFCCGIDFESKIDDPKIAHWILDPEGKEKNLVAMAIKYCPQMVKVAQLATGCKGVGSIGLDLFSSVESKIRASIEAVVTLHLAESLKSALDATNPNYLKVYEGEMDTVMCLAKMEINGVSIKKNQLQDLADSLNKQIAAIEKEAFSLAGRHFNFASSTEVAKVLGMFKGRKVSTKKQVLEKNEHPLSALILQWRKVNSILTKMIYPLLKTTESNRIRGCYITHTATGRITMHEPNLQTVAKTFHITSPLAKQTITINCRDTFEVPDNFILISADYCQLELRLLAHLSQDKLLCSIMRRPGDVFKSIAAKWNKVREDEVDDTMRQNTKNLCYAIIYGMKSKTLSNQLTIDEEEAAVFMDTFKNTYPGVKKYIQDTIENCKSRGYVETIFGRRRYLPRITDTNASRRGQAERQAVNTTVQGSAADIAKKAMAMVENELKEVFSGKTFKPKLVLHLHDELIYEVPVKYEKIVANIIKKNMENSIHLSVPFPVKLKTGKSWGQLTEYVL